MQNKFLNMCCQEQIQQVVHEAKVNKPAVSKVVNNPVEELKIYCDLLDTTSKERYQNNNTLFSNRDRMNDTELSKYDHGRNKIKRRTLKVY